MQVDRYNHLLFPRDATTGNAGNNPTATDKEPAPAKAGAAGLQAKPHSAAWGAQADARVANRTESVVLKIQWPDGTGTKPADIPLYTPGGRMPVAREVDSKAEVPVPSKLPQAAEQQPAQPDFVALAVSALREYRDDPERQRVGTQAPAAAAETHWSALRGLQQIAAKLNVFA